MSESSSGENASSQETCQSNSSYCSTLSESHAPLSRNRAFHSHSDSGISSLLPSDSFKYLTWQGIEQHDIQGSQLRCPRVREDWKTKSQKIKISHLESLNYMPHYSRLETEYPLLNTGGPPAEELLLQHEECTLPPQRRVPEKIKWKIWIQENWEECTDLGDPYQVENFKRILRRLIRVETLWLVDNSLVDLSAVRLPSCRILIMNKNHLTSFKQLPKIPQIQHLSLAENHIEKLTGLASLHCTPLESLVLKRNPCEFHQNYRKRVFSCLPNLKMLDGILKLPEDSSPTQTSIFSKVCTVS
ncbi:uncharacterized protein LOC119256889 isoform X2 [Talpa occidentalis]|uniref:uncharacterized protein LOC119256889 isoform X2 n=1 Tax=Talpa occidentalis TaxID=50954 RepID=UPI0023FA0541|nr:uncharacterized protein LOC119256889 isoform X2 [Talpa occidentalis]